MQIHPRVTRQSRDFVRTFERFRPEAEQSPRGVWTIGYGHRRTAREGARVSPGDADALLAFDLSEVAAAIEPLIFTPLEPNAFDALLSFSFSTGVDAFRDSEVLRRLNRGLVLAAAAALEAWRCADIGGDLQVVDALVRRRAVEKARFLTPAAGMPTFAGAASPPLRRFTPASTALAESASLSASRVVKRRETSAVPPQMASARLSPGLEPFRSPPRIESAAERVERVVAGEFMDVASKPRAPQPPALEVEASLSEPAPPPFTKAGEDSIVRETPSPFGPPDAPFASAETDFHAHDHDAGAGQRRARLAIVGAWLERSSVYAAIAVLGLGLFLVAVVCILDRPTVGLLALGLVGIVAMIPAVVRFAGSRTRGSQA